MPTSSSQSWSRGFSPLFRDPHADQHMRVSDAERQAVADRLGEHFADGRLDQEEFDERVGRAMSAKTRADLSGLFDDLPEPTGPPNAGGPDTAAWGSWAPGRPGGPGMPMPTRRRRHPVLVIALAVIVALAVVHTVPWLWIGFFVAVLFLARGGRHSHHASHNPNSNQDR
jgi:hypothetical protein